jgi:RNA polymerase subunit RPABC4/transcription elongation factor Spt4
MEMPIEVASVIRLGEAYFCLNCEVLTNCSDMCPACGHRQLWVLENWIGKINALENGSDKKGTLKCLQLAPVFMTA